MTRGRMVVGCLAALVVGIAGALWLAASFLDRSASVGPEAAGAALRGITELDLPPGYQPQFAMTLGDMSTVTIAPDFGGVALDEALVVTVMQARRSDAAGVSDAAAAAARDRLAAEMGATAGGKDARLEEVARQTITARGAPAERVTYEGALRDGTPIRKVSVAFEGAGGPALLVATAPAAAWDEGLVDALVGSLR